MKIYEYANCSTCKKALKFLDANGVHFKKVPIVDQPPSKTELRKMLDIYKGDLRKLFNTSGQVYREMGLSKRIESLSVDEALDLLFKNGKLIKRPFLLTTDSGLLGFNEAEWQRLFKPLGK